MLFLKGVEMASMFFSVGDGNKGSSGSFFLQIEGPQYRPQNAITLLFGTPQMVSLILGKPNP